MSESMPEIRRAIAFAMKEHGQSEEAGEQLTALFSNFVDKNSEVKRDLKRMISAISIPET